MKRAELLLLITLVAAGCGDSEPQTPRAQADQGTPGDLGGGDPSSGDLSSGGEPDRGMSARPGTIDVQSSAPCGSGMTCYEVQVGCLGLRPRGASIRVKRNTAANGGVLFTSGGAGGSYYGSTAPARQTVAKIAAAGFETFEIAWRGPRGWASNNAGAGLKAVMCGYATIVRWIATKASNPGLLCATGNSGGSMQVSYGLTLYGLDQVLTAVVPTGGPPTADLVDVCILPAKASKKRPGTYALMDYTFGWLGNGDYCQWGAAPQNVVAILNREGVVSPDPDEVRDLTYPKTHVSFVLGALDKENIPRARKYHDAITSSKSWRLVPGGPHAIHSDPGGASVIQSELLTHCATPP